MTPADPSRSRVASIAVYVCTHRRNGPLGRMLDSLAVAAGQVQPGTGVAVVVVDDNPDGRAKEVVDGFGQGDAFSLGLHYRYSGAQNISLARNTGLEAAMELADWVAMTDDDQVVTPQWFTAMVDMAQRTGAVAVTGPVRLRYPPGTPAWISSQPFDEILEAAPQPDGARMPTCSTGNSMLATSFLRDHPGIRFRSDLGKLGGEDMVFYRAAVGAGLDARFANDALCWAEQPPERSTFRSILRTCYWLGNTEFVTNIESGEASRLRLTLRAGRKLVVALGRPARQWRAGKPAQWRFAAAGGVRALGILVGVLGVKVVHQ